MNLTVHLPHVASWVAFFTVVTWMFVQVAQRCAASGPVEDDQAPFAGVCW